MTRERQSSSKRIWETTGPSA